MAMAKNVNIEVKGSTLVITCNLDEDYGPSKSGKTTIIASTEGNIAIPGHDGIKLGLNLYKNRK
jgi:hypothetical protein